MHKCCRMHVVTSNFKILYMIKDIKLDVLCPTMMIGVGVKMYGGDVVTVDNRSLQDVMMQLLE